MTFRLDPNSDTKQRLRRNAQRMSRNVSSEIVVADPITNDGTTLGLNVAVAGGLTLSSGLAIKLDTNPGLVLASTGLKVLVANTSLVLSSGGLAVNLATNSGLQVSSGLLLKLTDTSLVLASTGVAVNPAVSGGLDVSSGLRVKGFRTASSSPIAADGDTYYDTTNKAAYHRDGSLVERFGGVYYSSIAASSTVTNTTTETALDSTASIPANFFTPGKVCRLRAAGTYSTTGTPTLLIGVRLDSTTGNFIGGLTFTCSNNANILRWWIEVDVTCQVGGASGTMGRAGCEFVEFAPGPNVFQPLGFAPFSIDMTAAHNFVLTAAWGAASTSNIAVAQQVMCTAL